MSASARPTYHSYSNPMDWSAFSASIAAWQPVPAAVIAWR
jgi:hypothetical protein